MKLLNFTEQLKVSGGNIIPGTPSAEMLCLNTKLMVALGRGQPGFDVTVATGALVSYCASDFGDPVSANSYVTTGGLPVPAPTTTTTTS